MAAQTELTSRIVPLGPDPASALAAFLDQNPDAAGTADLLAALTDGAPDLAPLTVALRAVRSLL
jgi:hypothetical protein